MFFMTELKRMQSRTAVSGAALLLLAALWSGLDRAQAIADEKAPAAAGKVILGTWVADGDGIDSKWVFEAETLKASVQGVEYVCKYKVDTAAKPHPTVDLTIDEGPDESKGKTSKCIYKLDGEKLKLCVSLPGKDRPKEFEQVDGEAYLFELKKEKK
jgi:uncharacterized protein (TIGR03067 family)